MWIVTRGIIILPTVYIILVSNSIDMNVMKLLQFIFILYCIK